MSSNNKVMLIIFSMVSLLTLVVVTLVAIGSRQTGYESAIKKADLTANIIEKSLTSHMVNGNMDQRDVFLNSISQIKEVNDLWIVRSKKVDEQFGKSNLGNDTARDTIDEEVLNTGKEKIVTDESLRNATIRITIPYVASSFDKPSLYIICFILFQPNLTMLLYIGCSLYPEPFFPHLSIGFCFVNPTYT